MNQIINYKQHFGKQIEEMELVKQPNFIEQYEILFNGKEKDLCKINKGNFKTFLKWLSFNSENLPICQKLTKWFKYVDSNILFWLMYWKLDISNKYIKFLKKSNAKSDWLKSYFCQYFNWSERECNVNWDVIKEKIKDKETLHMLNKTFAFSDEECKMLDIGYEKVAKGKNKVMGANLYNFIKVTKSG